jgi:type II secretory pathway component GspD/PulD (secretin)
VGNLFKTTQRSSDKSELLIFITPKILRDGASLY